MCSLGSLLTGLRATLDSCEVGEAQEEEEGEEVLPRLVVTTGLEGMKAEYRTVLQPARAQDWSPPLDDTATAMLTALSLAVFTNSLGLDPSEEVNCRQTDVIEKTSKPQFGFSCCISYRFSLYQVTGQDYRVPLVSVQAAAFSLTCLERQLEADNKPLFGGLNR